ncbi:MAG: gliding motility-associated C-terminal domain-containing protein [Bacteroidota bacterium]
MVHPRLLCALAFFTTCVQSNAQTYFQRTLGGQDTLEQAFALEVLDNGNIATAGNADHFFNNSVDGMVSLLSKDGSLIWSRSVDLGGTEVITDLQKNQNGNLLALLHTEPFTSSVLSSFSCIVELSSVTGAVLNVQKIAGKANDLTEITPVSGGYLLTGSTWLTGGDEPVPTAIKIDENLHILWQTALSGPEIQGGYLKGAIEDSQGFIYSVGTIHNPDDNGLLVRFNQNGDPICKTIGSSANDLFTRIAPAKDGNKLLAGQTKYLGDGYYRIWTVETDPEILNIRESWSYGITGQNNDLSTGDLASIAGDQHLISTGNKSDQLGAMPLLFKFSSGNEVVQLVNFGGSALYGSFERLVVLPGNKGFVAAGNRVDQFGKDVFVTQTKTDLSLEDACCPKDAAGDARRDLKAGLSLKTIVPTLTKPLKIESAAFGSNDFPVRNQSICVPIDLAFTISKDSICPGEYVEVQAKGNTPDVQYEFSYFNGSVDQNHPERVYFGQSGAVIRTGQNSYCKDMLSKEVLIAPVPDKFPNVFTPNGDQVNDVFQPIFYCPVQTLDLKIYNRWGALVYETNDPNGSWDGKIQGLEAPSDVYIWRLEYKAERPQGGGPFVVGGSVTLLR